MRNILRLSAIVLALGATPVFAQQSVVGGTTLSPTNSSGAYSAATLGVTATTIIPATNCHVICEVVNNSATATICISVGGTATITGTACAAGEISLPPGWHKSWESLYIPSDAISAISSAASTPVTVGAK